MFCKEFCLTRKGKRIRLRLSTNPGRSSFLHTRLFHTSANDSLNSLALTPAFEPAQSYPQFLMLAVRQILKEKITCSAIRSAFAHSVCLLSSYWVCFLTSGPADAQTPSASIRKPGGEPVSVEAGSKSC